MALSFETVPPVRNTADVVVIFLSLCSMSCLSGLGCKKFWMFMFSKIETGVCRWRLVFVCYLTVSVCMCVGMLSSSQKLNENGWTICQAWQTNILIIIVLVSTDGLVGSVSTYNAVVLRASRVRVLLCGPSPIHPASHSPTRLPVNNFFF